MDPDPPDRPEGTDRNGAWRIFPHPDQELLRENLARWIAQTNPCAYRSALRSLMRFETMSGLSELRMPVLVITGAEDTTVPPSVQYALARGIPGARHIVVEGSGHGVIADNPDTFNCILLEFLTEVRG